MHICEMALNPYLIRCLIHDTDMLFLLLKNAKDTSLAESSLFDAGTSHTYKEKLSLLMAKEKDHTKCL